jgi:hypothetical protein
MFNGVNMYTDFINIFASKWGRHEINFELRTKVMQRVLLKNSQV